MHQDLTSVCACFIFKALHQAVFTILFPVFYKNLKRFIFNDHENKQFNLYFSVNLMASMGTLATVAKHRPQFMSIVVQAFETLHGE